MVYYLIDDAGALIGPVELPVIPGFGPQLPSNAVDLPNELPEPGTHTVWAMVDGAPKEMPDRRGPVYRTDTEPQTWGTDVWSPSGREWDGRELWGE